MPTESNQANGGNPSYKLLLDKVDLLPARDKKIVVGYINALCALGMDNPAHFLLALSVVGTGLQNKMTTKAARQNGE